MKNILKTIGIGGSVFVGFGIALLITIYIVDNISTIANNMSVRYVVGAILLLVAFYLIGKICMYMSKRGYINL